MNTTTPRHQGTEAAKSPCLTSASRLGTLLGLVLITTATNAPANGQPSSWSMGGDLRMAYLASWRDTREQLGRSEDNFRLRIRHFLSFQGAEHWQFRMRLAGTYALDGNDFNWFVKPYRPSRTGVRAGDATLDQFYLNYRDAHDRWQLRLGRFSTSFNLPIVAAKSLDRNDASNFNIGWTDGAHLRWDVSEQWQLHLIGQRNHRRGTGNTAREPIDFDRSASRASWYAAISARQSLGPISLRMLSINWIPDGLAVSAIDPDRREHYLTATVKAAAEWPIGNQGMRLLLAGEAGHAFERPARERVGLSGAQRVSGNAMQASANLMDIRPGHDLGVVYGRAQAGWLISNDYRNNDQLAEIRYRWRVEQPIKLTTEFRYRWRRELEVPNEANRSRRDQDIYLRLTFRY